MTYTTDKSILLNNRDFFVGVNTYDITTVPTNQIKVTASDGAANDNFGNRIAIGSGRIVVGANGDDSNRGSAYVYDLNGNYITKITASDRAAGDYFGYSVAVASGRIVVGAFADDSYKGSAYIFQTNGSQIKKITASDGVANDYFGISVTIGSGRIVIGASGDESGKGSAYVYDLNGNFITKITASDAATGDYFGSPIAVGSGRIIIGSPSDDDKGSNSGSAYIYDLSGNFITKITAYDGVADDYFGAAVAVGSGRIAIGLNYDDDKGTDSGSVYVYDLNGNFITKITASDGVGYDYFGISVAVGSGRIVIGSQGDDDKGDGSGSAYVYDLNGNFITKITASDGAAGDGFGAAVAVGSGRIVVGAYGDDDKGSNSGSAYIYTTPDQKHFLDLLD